MTPLLVIPLLILGTALSAENRTFDGSGNNAINTIYGSAGSPLLRVTASAYVGDSSLVRSDQASPREISNAIFDQAGVVGNDRGLSDFIWAWGQFVDHDIDLTPAMVPLESEPIAVPTGDPTFDPMSNGGVTLPFSRSQHNGNEFRDQINVITSWHDSSNVYGSSATVASALQGSDGKLLSQTVGGLEYLPFADGLGVSMANEGPPNPSLFAAGDVRANEVSSLISLHTLMMREHNRVADLLFAMGGKTDDEIFHLARKVVSAEAQAITYNEYLPSLGVSLTGYSGYDSSVQPDISNEFSTAAFRMGHTQVSSTVLRLDDGGNSVGDLTVANSFFNPDIVLSGGIESILRGLSSKEAQEVDTNVVDDLRNLLFGPPPLGTDLVAMNIQRGRDHGLPDYNTMRAMLGLGSVTSFDEITSDMALADLLELIYIDLDNIDPWVAMLAEDHLADSSVGLTIHAILVDQFQRLRDGDRFWYQNDQNLLDLLPSLGMTLETDGNHLLLDRTLASLILDNTDIGAQGFDMTPQTNVFLVMAVPEPASYLLLTFTLLFVGATGDSRWRRARARQCAGTPRGSF